MVKISSKIQAAQFTIYVLAYPYPLLFFYAIDPATKVQGYSNGNRDSLLQGNDNHDNFVIQRKSANAIMIAHSWE
jgi:hypothetical protein